MLTKLTGWGYLGRGHFWAHGHIVNKPDKGPLAGATSHW